MNTNKSKIAINASEESNVVVGQIEITECNMTVQQLQANGLLWGIHEDPLGNLIAVDTDRNRYPVKD